MLFFNVRFQWNTSKKEDVLFIVVENSPAKDWVEENELKHEVVPEENVTPEPTAEPTPVTTTEPTETPTAEPTATPTAEPTATPTAEPTATPTVEPTPVTEYTVTCSPGEGNGTIKTSKAQLNEVFTLFYPGQIGFSAPEGKVFKAWLVNGVEYGMDDSFVITEDVTIIALWEAGECTISFDANGGSGRMEPVTIIMGEAFELPVCEFTAPEGMKFKAWLLDTNELPVGLVINPIFDTVLKAVWEIEPVIIPFTWTVNGDGEGVTITGYTGTDPDMVIPDKIEGYPVVAIGNSAFAENGVRGNDSIN